MPDNFNEKDIEDIYNRHVNTVYRVCYMFMKNRSEAEDAVQTTFLKLMNSNISFKDHSHEKAWLIVTASNVCKNSLKHWSRSKSRNYEDYINDFKHIDTHEFEILEEVLSLPEKYKTVIYLYYYEGYSSVEISKILGVKEATIRSWLYRGRKLLKKSLGGMENG